MPTTAVGDATRHAHARRNRGARDDARARGAIARGDGGATAEDGAREGVHG